MDKEVLISIIVPVYNLENELTRCVASITAQTYSNLEVILVDDGSKDHSRSVIQQLAETDSRIVPVYKENGGVTSARLEGVRRATGDYIGFVDGDDEIEPDMYERLFNNAQKYQADISHCGYQMIFPDGHVNYFYNKDHLVKQDNITGLKDLLAGSFVEPGLWNKLFHKSLFQSLLYEEIMDTTIRINEDLLMNYYLFKQSRLSIYEDFCPYHYLIRNNSVSQSTLSKYKIYDPIKVKQIILQHCTPDIKIAAEKALLNTCIYTYCGLTVEKSKEFREDKVKVREQIIEFYSHAKELPRRTSLLAGLIVKMPLVFEVIYPMYVKCLQKGKYE